ncbi:MAG TPA: aminotransferase class V-fold PLP-dependent enzyme, partial [Candidatus Paceibacterota bacterium]|nr:aminotransferase class V-fold PLP-dependent enzyme [Candidatus Paceibacterota bacterium]
MYANNEIGTIEPLAELSEALCQKRKAGFPLLHTDACQAAGFLPIRPRELGVDLMTLNGSKIYGPRGVGMLYVRDGVRLCPLTVGGAQEHGLHAGTENLPLIIGFARALEIAERERPVETKRLSKLRDHFIDRVRRELPEAI